MCWRAYWPDIGGKALDIATAYFTVGGWHLLQTGLRELGHFRLLLGDEPESGQDIGLRQAGAKPVKGLIRDLAAAPYDLRTARQVEDLIAFLRQGNVEVRLYKKGFLHAKCYLFYEDSGWDAFAPVAAIVGSSNFTRPGLTTNKELNLSHRANLAAAEVSPDAVRGLLEAGDTKNLATIGEGERVAAANLPGVLAINQLSAWYSKQWDTATDFKEELITLLNESKFGRKEYSPHEVYMKAVFEYFRDDLDAEEARATRSAVDLSEFQEDAVTKARRILARYDGVLVGDSVGLGKTWIGKKLLEDYAYFKRYMAVVVCPAALRKMWETELQSASIAGQVVTQESLGREEFDARPYEAADVVLIDESHNFRNPNAQRYEAIERNLVGQRAQGQGKRHAQESDFADRHADQ